MSIASLSSYTRFAPPPPTQARPTLQTVSAEPLVHNTQRTGARLGSNFKIEQYTNDLTYFLCQDVLDHFLNRHMSLDMWANDSFITLLGQLIRGAVDPFAARYVRSIQTIQQRTPNSLLLDQNSWGVRLTTNELLPFAYKRLKYEKSKPQSSLPKAPCFEDEKRIITFSLPFPCTVGNSHRVPQLLNTPNPKTLKKNERRVPPLLQTLLDNKEGVADAEGRLNRLLAQQIRQHLGTPIINTKTMQDLLTNAGQLQGLEEQARAIECNLHRMSRQFGIKPEDVQPSN